MMYSLQFQYKQQKVVHASQELYIISFSFFDVIINIIVLSKMFFLEICFIEIKEVIGK